MNNWYKESQVETNNIQNDMASDILLKVVMMINVFKNNYPEYKEKIPNQWEPGPSPHGIKARRTYEEMKKIRDEIAEELISIKAK